MSFVLSVTVLSILFFQISVFVVTFVLCCFVFFFFFSSRRRHTRCLSDWSSDVCSSDLARRPRRGRERGPAFEALDRVHARRLGSRARVPLVAASLHPRARPLRRRDRVRSEERRVGKECRSRGARES